MPLPIPRYPFDPTGTSANNRIVGEVHTLTSTRPVRAVVPRFAAFYANSLVLVDADENRVLTRGHDGDYIIVDIVRIGTAKVGLEMAQTILILNGAVSPNLRMDYQAVGGHYQTLVPGIENLYETVLQDGRPVDWANIINRPYEYNPSEHNHMLWDIIGFEFVVAAIDRLSNAVTLTNVPAFEALIDWVIANVPQVASLSELDTGLPMGKVISVEGLQFILSRYNFNSMKLTPSKSTFNPGSVQTFMLETSNMPDGRQLFWTIKHIDTNDADFPYRHGSMTINNNKTYFSVGIGNSFVSEAKEDFQIQIRRLGINGPVIMESNILSIAASTTNPYNELFDAKVACCHVKVDFPFNAVSYYMNRHNKSPVF